MKVIVPEKETDMIKKILKRWEKKFGAFPRDYFCFDLETTGFAFNFNDGDEEESNDDLIVEIGHCSVEDGYAKFYESRVLNWFESEHVETDWLEWKLEKCYQHMRKAGRTCHMSAERMRDEGEDPIKVLEEYKAELEAARDDGKVFVGHNLALFDSRVFSNATEEWLGNRFELGDNEVMDTAAVEKASECGMEPWTHESLMEYFRRVSARPAPGVKYNMDHCVKKHRLNKKYSLDMDKAHTAGFDAMLCHLLMEEYREISERS